MQDAKCAGSKQAFAATRGPQKGPVTAVLDPHRFELDGEISQDGLSVHFSCAPSTFVPAIPLKCQDQLGWITDHSGSSTTVTFPEAIEFQSPFVLEQQNRIVEPSAIADALTAVWLPLWQSTEVVSPQQIQDFDDLLQALPPAPNDVTVEHTISTWRSAINDMKTHAATSFDAISAAELRMVPDTLLQLLIDCLLSYRSGFPKWFLRSRVCPLNKTDATPFPHETRPITIMATLYRLYAAVTCRQILVAWNKFFPDEVTGMMPTRGADTAAFHQQQLLETSHFLKTPLSGVTLDLRKCFNCILHHVAPKLLRKLGVCQSDIDRWFLSITQLSRSWEICGFCFGDYGCDRGFAEGDSHSVLIILAITYLWIHTIRAKTPGTFHLSAYANNWSWSVVDTATHASIAECTSLVTGLTGLSIDWKKTWMWATTTPVAKKALEVISQVLPETQVQRLHHSRDLGFELRFSGCHANGHRDERIHEGLARIQRLTFLQADVQVKEKMWLSSIFACMFHGTEIHPPADELVKQIRSKVADAIYGRSKSMNPAIALLLGTRQILDPGFLIVAKCIRTARRWLLQHADAYQSQFFRMAAAYTGRSSAIKGPAATLKFHLAKMGWDITDDGSLILDTGIKLHLVSDSYHTILLYLGLTWQNQLFSTLTTRQELQDAAPISRVETVSILNTFPPEERLMLVREISGAYQLETQKMHWDPTVTGFCPFCLADDSKAHRILDCPAFADIRERYPHVIRSINTLQPSFPDMPVVHPHDMADTHMLMHKSMPRQCIADEFLTFASERAETCQPVHIYTDGSCRFPESPTTRFATYAVVVDLCADDDERRQYADRYLADGSLPPSLQPMLAAHLHGLQGINRAELCALADAASLPGNTFVHADSQYALNVADHLRAGTFDMVKCHHPDLAAELNSHLRPEQSFLKIAAHQNLHEIPDLLQLYHALGNKCANDVAYEACHHHMQPWIDALTAAHQEQERRRVFVREAYSFLVELARLRMTLLQTLADELHADNLQQAAAAGDTPLVLMSQWTPSNTRCFPPLDSIEQLFKVYPWGRDLGLQMSNWLLQIQWPTEPCGPPCCNDGISWLELAVSFVFSIGRCLPILRTDEHGVTQLVNTACAADIPFYNVTFADITRTFVQMWNHFTSWYPKDVNVPPSGGSVKSLYWLGFSQYSGGLVTRPVIPFQAATITFVQEHVKGRSNLDVTWVSPCELPARVSDATSVPWIPLRNRSNRQKATWKRTVTNS
eukprot:Skav207804  [mRNA]  locus=scaffold381:63692:67435:+ [translate_table: standard]